MDLGIISLVKKVILGVGVVVIALVTSLHI